MPYPKLLRDVNGTPVDLDELGMIINVEYNTDSLPLYTGYAAPGTATSSPRWMIVTFSYDISGNMLAKKFARGKADFTAIWDNRATYTYS